MNELSEKMFKMSKEKELGVPLAANHYTEKGIIPHCSESIFRMRRPVGLYCGGMRCEHCVLPELWKATSAYELDDTNIELTLDKIKIQPSGSWEATEYSVVELKYSFDEENEKIVEVVFQNNERKGKAFRCKKNFADERYHWEVYFW